MTILDWVLLVALFGYIAGGWGVGLIQSIGGFIGFLLAVILTPRLAGPFGDFLSPVFGGNDVFARIAAFIILFLLIARLVGLLFAFVNKLFNLIAILPGLKLLNKLGGAFFGLLEGSLFLGVLLQYVVRLPLGPGLTEAIDRSALTGAMLTLSGWLVPLFPKALRETEKVIDRIVPKS